MSKKTYKLNSKSIFKKNENLRKLINKVIVLKDKILKEHNIDLNCDPKIVKKI